jgi:hypothetical protein
LRIAVAGAPASECVPDVVGISATAGVPLVSDVLTVAPFPAFFGIPGVVSFSAVAFIPAFAGVSAVAVVPAVECVFDVATLLILVSYIIVAGIFPYCTTVYNEAYIGHRSIGLSFFSVIKLSDYQISDWRIRETMGLSDIRYRIKATIYLTIGLTKNYRLPTSVK